MTKPRGFAAMSPEKRKSLAALGGKAAHANGTAHRWTSAEAAMAGKKGGASVSADRVHMSELGVKGATTRNAQRTAKP